MSMTSYTQHGPGTATESEQKTPLCRRNWDYWYNVRNRLLVNGDCLLLDETIIIPQQLRQTILGRPSPQTSGCSRVAGLI